MIAHITVRLDHSTKRGHPVRAHRRQHQVRREVGHGGVDHDGQPASRSERIAATAFSIYRAMLLHGWCGSSDAQGSVQVRMRHRLALRTPWLRVILVALGVFTCPSRGIRIHCGVSGRDPHKDRPATAGNGFEPCTLGSALDALNLAIASDSSQAIACATSTPSSGATPDRALVRPRSCSFERTDT